MNNPPVGDYRRRAVNQGGAQQGGAIFEVVPGLDDLVEALRQLMSQSLSFGTVTRACASDQSVMDLGQSGQTVAQRDKITGSAAIKADPGGKALQIVHLSESFPEPGSSVVVVMEKGHAFLDALNGSGFAPGVAKHIFQKAAAHGCHGVIKDMSQRALAFAPVEPGEDFQIALGHLVDQQTATQIQRLEGLEVIRVPLLGLSR